MARPSRIVVVGGGLSGLAAAHRLTERTEQVPLDIHLLEASPRLGGLIETETIQGCTVELGADSFISNKPAALNLCRRLGLEQRLTETHPAHRRAFVLCDGRPRPVPRGFRLMLPGDLRALRDSRILSDEGFTRVLAERHIPPSGHESDESVGDFVRRRFGEELLKQLVQPLIGGIYTSDPERLSLSATFPEFRRMEQEAGSLLRAARRGDGPVSGSPQVAGTSGARYGLFLTLAGGLSVLTGTLEQRLRSTIDVRICSGVRSVSRSDGHADSRAVGWNVETATDRIHAEAVIVALPTYVTASLLSESATRLAAALRQIEYASSAVVVTAHRTSEICHPLDAFGLVIPESERRRILAVSFLHRKFPDHVPPGVAILRTFVGGAMHPERLQQDDDALQALVRDELRELLGVTGQPLFTRVTRYEDAMPQYLVGHSDRVRQIEQLTSEEPGLFLAGNGLHGVGIPDAVAAGERAADAALRFISQDG